MNSNIEIIDNILKIGKEKGFKNPTQICRAAGFAPSILTDLKDKVKTSPRVDTLNKFANALNCSISDLIYPLKIREKTDILEIWEQLTEFEQIDVRSIMAGMILKRKYGMSNTDGLGEKRSTIRKLKVA